MKKLPDKMTVRLRCTDEPMLYCDVKFGRRYEPIAKRAPGGRWESLKVGWAVSGSQPGDDYSEIYIERANVEAMQ